MKLRRWAYYIFAALSLVSFLWAILAAALWIRSHCGRHIDLVAWYSTIDRHGWQSGGTIAVRRGYFALWGGFDRSDYRSEPGWSYSFRRDDSSQQVDDAEDRPRSFGIAYRRTSSTIPGNGFGAMSRPYFEWYFAISSPLLLTLLLIAPAAWLLCRLRENRRLAAGVRATPERPERGMEVAR
jgi:hypothetical protein